MLQNVFQNRLHSLKLLLLLLQYVEAKNKLKLEINQIYVFARVVEKVKLHVIYLHQGKLGWFASLLWNSKQTNKTENIVPKMNKQK